MANDLEDDESVQSATTQDQISFWTLTGSFMLKLLAMGITLFILPFNEWLMLESSQRDLIVIVSGGLSIKVRQLNYSVESPAATAYILGSNPAR